MTAVAIWLSSVDELGALVLVEQRDVLAEHAIGAGLGERPAFVQRLGFGEGFGPAEHAGEVRRPHDERFDRTQARP